MEKKFIQSLTKNFESFAHKTEDGVEFWLARDLQHLLDYSKWDNFQNVISKAKTACELSGAKISDHFADVGKTIEMPKNAQKEIDDIISEDLSPEDDVKKVERKLKAEEKKIK